MLLLASAVGSLAVSAQNETGLSLFPIVESGGTVYFVSDEARARPTNLSTYFGAEVEFRASSALAVRMGLVAGGRNYDEQYQFSTIKYNLNHELTEVGWRLYIAQTLRTNGKAYWELCYGLSTARAIRYNVTVSNSEGNAGDFGAHEPRSWGVRLGAMHSRRSWLRGTLRVGIVANLQLISTQADLYLPWLSHDSLGVGRSRLFTGMVISLRIARMPWKVPSQDSAE